MGPAGATGGVTELTLTDLLSLTTACVETVTLSALVSVLVLSKTEVAVTVMLAMSVLTRLAGTLPTTTKLNFSPGCSEGVTVMGVLLSATPSWLASAKICRIGVAVLFALEMLN